jgi:hypothetical protein
LTPAEHVRRWSSLLSCAHSPGVCVILSRYPGILRVCLRPKAPGRQREHELLFDPVNDKPERIGQQIEAMRGGGNYPRRVFTEAAIKVLKGCLR